MKPLVSLALILIYALVSQYSVFAQPKPLKEIAEWTETYRHIWEQRFDRLESYLQELQAKEKTHGRQPRRK